MIERLWMSGGNRKYFALLALFIVVFLGIEAFLKQQVQAYAIHEGNAKLDNILTNQKALHTYVEKLQKPVIYKLKEEGKLYDEFFDPNILSFTYIARNIHSVENEILESNHKTPRYYKLASNNPRNDLNRASDFEKELIEKFNRTKEKDFKDIIEEDGKKYLYYAKPVGANQESCMKCHGDPQAAPVELISQYGDSKGFYEKLGDIRAIISIKIPLEEELATANRYYFMITAFILASLLLIFILIVYLMRSLDKKQRELEKLSVTDPLTHCYNRRAFTEDINHEIERSSRTGELFSVISFDIDHFKTINDTYGHQIGDKVLLNVANIIAESNRKYDSLYRVGGEEFMVILPHTNQEEAATIAERLRTLVEESDFKYTVTISAGVYTYDGESSYHGIYKKVDSALYVAKGSGRNTVQVYHPNSKPA